MNKYKTLLFDLDGVILDFNLAEQHSFIKTFKQIGIDVDEAIFKCYHQINEVLWKAFELGELTKEEVTTGRFKRLFKELNIDYDYRKFARDYQLGLADGYFLMPKAKAVLKRLAKDYRLYAVTNGVSNTAYKRLRGTDTLKYFEAVFVSEDLHAQKPSMDYFKQVFLAIDHFEPATTLLIGDSLSSDIQGANNANIDSCWINLKQQALPVTPIPTYQIKQLEDILEILVKRD